MLIYALNPPIKKFYDMKQNFSEIVYRPLVKSVYQKKNSLFSQPKLMLWVTQRTVNIIWVRKNLQF